MLRAEPEDAALWSDDSLQVTPAPLRIGLLEEARQCADFGDVAQVIAQALEPGFTLDRVKQRPVREDPLQLALVGHPRHPPALRPFR